MENVLNDQVSLCYNHIGDKDGEEGEKGDMLVIEIDRELIAWMK